MGGVLTPEQAALAKAALEQLKTPPGHPVVVSICKHIALGK